MYMYVQELCTVSSGFRFCLSQMYGMAVANKLDNNQNILQRRYFRQVGKVSLCMNYMYMYVCMLYSGCFHLQQSLLRSVHV